MFLPEISLLIGILVQGIALIFYRPNKNVRLLEYLYVAMILSSSFFLARELSIALNTEVFSMLKDHSLFRLPRLCILISAMVVGRILSASGEVPEARKPGVLFLFSLCLLFMDVLILSQHMGLSLLVMACLSFAALFSGGLSFRGRLEGEAILKQWLQGSFALVLGVGALVALILVAGGLDLSLIASYVQGVEEYSPQRLFLISSLFLPFLLYAGLFPFHFAFVDRDQGIPWPVLAFFTVLVQGALALAIWKIAIQVFAGQDSAVVTDGLRVLQVGGMLGGFVLLLFALGQPKSKRFFSAYVGAFWSALLAIGAISQAHALASVVFAFSANFLWGVILALVWARLQEASKRDNIGAVRGWGARYRRSGIILLLALATPLCVPGFPGFPALLNLLATVIAQKALLLLAFAVALFVLQCYASAQLASSILFREESNDSTGAVVLRYAWGDVASVLFVLGLLLLLGVAWERAFAFLSEAAKAFL